MPSNTTFADEVAATRARLEAREAAKAEEAAAARAVVDHKLRKVARKKDREAAARRQLLAAFREHEERRKEAARREAAALRRRLVRAGSLVWGDAAASDDGSVASDASDGESTDTPMAAPYNRSLAAVMRDSGTHASGTSNYGGAAGDDDDELYSSDTDPLGSLVISHRLLRNGFSADLGEEREAEIKAALKEMAVIKRKRILGSVLRLQGWIRGLRERKALADQGVLPQGARFRAVPIVTDSGMRLPKVLIARPQPYAAKHLAFEVNGCDLVTLVELITQPNVARSDLTRLVLVTHTAFVTTHTLVTLLTLRFDCMPLSHVTYFVAHTLPGIQAKVFDVLGLWISDYFVSFADPESAAAKTLVAFLDRVADLHTCYCLKATRKLARKLKRKYLKRVESYAADRRGLGPLSANDAVAAPQSILIGSTTMAFSVLEVHALEVARQLTLLDFAAFHAIESVELLKQKWAKHPDECPNVIAAIERFNTEVAWAATEVLRGETTEVRAHAICLLLDVAANLSALHNYAGLMAIISALSCAAVDRLKWTWARVPEDYMTILADLRELMSMSHNYRAYRDVLRKSLPPLVPYLGVHLQDLVFIDDGNETRLAVPDSDDDDDDSDRGAAPLSSLMAADALAASDSDSDSDSDSEASAASKGRPIAPASPAAPVAPAANPLHDLFNIEKQRMTYNVICEVLAFQAKRYIFHPVDSIVAYLDSVPVMDDKAQYARSLEVEPRGWEPSRKDRRPIEHHPQEGSERPELDVVDARFMDEILSVMRRRHLDPGVVVVRKGDLGSSMYFVAEGVVTVELDSGKQFDLNQGAFFGEIALFLEQPRSATIRAKTDVVLLELTKTNLDPVLRKFPAMYMEFKRLGEERLASDHKGKPEIPKWMQKVSAM
ncbi:Ras guanine nucleotide exchange factor A [Thecamonas trahens ATCC 50062]|uniref:Ras guanine nucleotide exchange factor A n=1 Tax=Thecamonas trahens ATCC 50062 TaxID=461836 RepID=A0A0L0D3A4_THETB|nr:Ras guanine nucleotide exchange factor A [Thecamonas trahens ATCC 50062]KNC46651.1 Ras guanine nucleotide exchange factor A [Thecamonas trahens ATCC 50062]|eukprot:XP_013760424.1 Ras guanine nucleotide exchange factor A [Thecamonas trahens ATCC 50062]